MTNKGIAGYERTLNSYKVAVCISKSGARLALGQVEITTALALCHRFYRLQSYEQFHMYYIVGACLFLSTKICEVPRTLRSIVNVIYTTMNKTTEPLGAGKIYSNTKTCIINAEQTILRVLNFDMEVELPFSFLLNYAHAIGCSESCVKFALQLASDFFYDARAIEFPPFVIASSCLYISLKAVDDQHVPSNTKWWYLYDTSDQDIAEVSDILKSIFTHIEKEMNVVPQAKDCNSSAV